MKRSIALVLAALILGAVVAPSVTAASADSQSRAYAGTHVAFGTEGDAVVNYAVDNTTVLQSVAVQSESAVQSDTSIDLGVDLGAVTDIAGAALSLSASSETSATVETDSGAALRAHDNEHGSLVVASGDSAQVVTANLSSDAETTAESDSRVSVTSNGTQGTFIVVGNGTATVNDDGDVTARLGSDSHLVFRAYPDEKPESAEETESLIANGTATAGVYVMTQDGETVTDTVRYGSETTVNVTQTTSGEVQMAVDRTSSEGKVVVTTVSESVLDASEGVSVMVDGEAAASASSYAELRQAANGGAPKYMVEGAGSASANAQVLVAIDHFSTRAVTMQESGDDGDGTTDGGEDSDNDGNDATTTDDAGDSSGGVPGFTVGAALVGLTGAALVALRRR